MQITHLAEMYISSQRLAEDTRSHYRFVARLFVSDMKVTQVTNITHDMITEWRNKVLSRNATVTTWNNYFRHFRILLIFAVKLDIISDPPIGKGDFERDYRMPVKTIPTDQLCEVMAFLESENSPFQPTWYWAAMVRTYFYTGMRRRQLIFLRWSDIDFDRRKITFRAESSKTGVSWEIPLTLPAMSAFITIRTNTVDALGQDVDLAQRFVFDIALFNRRYHCRGRMSPMTVTNFFRRLSDVSGIRVSAHRLRHSMATLLAREGKYRELQNLLGHRSMQTTMRYIHPELEEMRLLLASIDDLGV